VQRDKKRGSLKLHQPVAPGTLLALCLLYPDAFSEIYKFVASTLGGQMTVCSSSNV
jgi:hypothetical protein